MKDWGSGFLLNTNLVLDKRQSSDSLHDGNYDSNCVTGIRNFWLKWHNSRSESIKTRYRVCDALCHTLILRRLLGYFYGWEEDWESQVASSSAEQWGSVCVCVCPVIWGHVTIDEFPL